MSGGHFELCQGDLHQPMDIRLTVNGAVPEDPFDGDAELRVELPDFTVESWALVPLDKDLWIFRHVFEPGETDDLGVYHGWVVLTFTDTTQQTFPSTGARIRWKVNPLPEVT
jgi:hypothetical protein